MYQIYFDSIQEGVWFQELHPDLSDAELLPFPSAKEIPKYHPQLQNALSFDRPDIILCDEENPILVIERTIEVPSGHNVGQRFARLVAAAKHQIPVVYFGPYAAYKHGGDTQGPRYMNLRLFYALEKMSQHYNTPITIINWIVDDDYEIIRDSSKDDRMIDYLNMFFSLYKNKTFPVLRKNIIHSKFEEEQHNERIEFIDSEVKKPEQYDIPPPSILELTYKNLTDIYPEIINKNIDIKDSIVYKVGMRYVRSDPYTGAALLYVYLYCGGLEGKTKNMILHFNNLTESQWKKVASSNTRKDVRLYKMVSDAIIFKDGILDSTEF